jgi:hypothetical protein
MLTSNIEHQATNQKDYTSWSEQRRMPVAGNNRWAAHGLAGLLWPGPQNEELPA